MLHGLSLPRSGRPWRGRWSAFGEAAQYVAHFHAGHRPENGKGLFESTGRKPLREGFLVAQVLEDGRPAGERGRTLIEHVTELTEIPSIVALLPGVSSSSFRWTPRQHLSLYWSPLEININCNKRNYLNIIKSFLIPFSRHDCFCFNEVASVLLSSATATNHCKTVRHCCTAHNVNRALRAKWTFAY